MNLHPSIKTVRTIKLFSKKYKYKIVVVSPIAYWFRNNNLKNVASKLSQIKTPGQLSSFEQDRCKNPDDVKFAHRLLNFFSRSIDYNIRVASPYLTVYTNCAKDIELMANLDFTKVKYVSLPQQGQELLESNTVVLKRLDYAYKINLKNTNQELSNFINWASNNKKIRLTKRVIKDLNSRFSLGGGHFYVKDDKTLSVVRLFVGPYIRSVETVVKL